MTWSDMCQQAIIKVWAQVKSIQPDPKKPPYVPEDVRDSMIRDTLSTTRDALYLASMVNDGCPTGDPGFTERLQLARQVIKDEMKIMEAKYVLIHMIAILCSFGPRRRERKDNLKRKAGAAGLDE